MEMRCDIPKVSMIVPVYKVEAYLHECIDSVLNQTYADYELILVDDGSPDRCGEICEEYARKDCRIRVIHKENGGLSSARNAGLDVARGKYIYFLDSDDTIAPQLLSAVVEKMDMGMDMVVFQFCRQYADGRKEKCCFHETGAYRMSSEEERVRFVMKQVLRGMIGWEACFRMYDRKKIERYSLRFADNRTIFAEDLHFCLCYCAHAENILSIDDCLYNYRMRDDSIMGVQQKKVNIGRFYLLSNSVQEFFGKFDDCGLFLDNMDIIRAQIILKQAASELWTSALPPKAFRDAVWESVSDKQALKCQLKEAIKRKDMYEKIGSVADALDMKAHARFLLGGSWTVLRAQCKLVRIIRMMQGG